GSAPAPRLQHGAVYDPNSNTMIVIGGDDCFSTLFEDVSVLSNADGRGGTPTWTQLNPSGTGPGARELHNQVAYDPGSNTLIVFGGIGPGGTLFNDVWVLSNANGQGGTPTWSQLSPSGSLPPARSEGSVIYDAASGRLTVFGGEGPQLLNDVWVLTNANGSGGTPTWNQLGPFSPFPEARGDHSAVYVPSTNQMIVFGGLISDTLPTNNAWILSHANGM
ncbi:MAG TPA: kelch repeat-containing protein, partial [Candidatus Acidoferrales bacterium]|nr:kelch repeat-containing protein [Candidatus Acidoferrales bacterium]